MTKIAIINDTHFGVRRDHKGMAAYIDRFFDEIFFPTIDEMGIKRVFHLGDLVHSRTQIAIPTAAQVYQTFFEPLSNRGIDVDIIVGNHDTYYKNTNSVNVFQSIFARFDLPNVTVHRDLPVEFSINDIPMMLVPWICDENREQSLQMIAQSNARFVWGHFEIAGFEMDRGHKCDHGMGREMFAKFDRVFSGHFHHPSEYGNIKYLGAPYEMTWSDYDGVRGFHIFDTETCEIQFIENPFKMFVKLYYDDDQLTAEDVAQLPVDNIRGSFVKVIIENKKHPYIYDLFIDKLQSAGLADIKTIESSLIFEQGIEEALDAEDTVTIFVKYVNALKMKSKTKAAVEKRLRQLYEQAINQ